MKTYLHSDGRCAKNYAGQETLNELFNGANMLLASVSHCYHSARNNNKDFIYEFQRELKLDQNSVRVNKAITSTRIIFDTSNLEEGNLIHNYKSRRTEEIERKGAIPSYDNISLENILLHPEGLVFIKDLLLTKDANNVIIDTLRELSGTKEINVYIPEVQDREKYSHRIVGFRYDIDGSFKISAGYGADTKGKGMPVHLN